MPHPFSLAFSHGKAIFNGQPRLLISADYPYYRDTPANWSQRLAAIKSLGIDIVTAYIPWRHHQPLPNVAPDFDGRSQPNRDVATFIRLCQENDLALIAKPGPFIHAETNYGGLPDWVCPLLQPAIEPLLDARGGAVSWSGGRFTAAGDIENWPLPAPFDPTFRQMTTAWLACVGEQVLRPFMTPRGPIVAVQTANEGIYSNGQHAPWAYDYSASGLAAYARFLQARYASLEAYNRLHQTAHRDWQAIPAPRQFSTAANDLHYQDWGEFQAEYMRLVFDAWSAPLRVNAPVMVNQNPPLGEPFGLDAWLTRVEPERWPNVQYGFTNWVGDISANPQAFDRYLLIAKRYPGVNLEENWGFAELYDPAYVDAATSFYQTLALLNAGATGFNVYTAAATGFQDTHLELRPKPAYPDASPIDELGHLTPKAEILRWLASFMNRYGAEFLECRPSQPVAWGVILPYARSGAWAAGQRATHGQALAEFQKQMRQLHLDYALINLEDDRSDALWQTRYLMTFGEKTMPRRIQQRLAEFVRRGGKLALVGEWPSLDESGAACDLLSADAGAIHFTAYVSLTDWLAGVERVVWQEGDADIWTRSHAEKDVHYITILQPLGNTSPARFELNLGGGALQFTFAAPPAGGALLRLSDGKITDAVIKGANHFHRSALPPRLQMNDQRIGSDLPGDFASIGGETLFLPAGLPVSAR